MYDGLPQPARASNLHAVRTLIIDGTRFSDFDGFVEEFSRLLPEHAWNGNLDAFNDILSDGYAIVWNHSDASREQLGHPAMATHLESVLSTCHPSNRRVVRKELKAAQGGQGPTLFDLIVEIIEAQARLELS